MIKLVTYDGKVSSPIWNNFRLIHKSAGLTVYQWINYRNKLLKSLNITPRFDSITEYIEFAHEEDYIRFVLEYS